MSNLRKGSIPITTVNTLFHITCPQDGRLTSPDWRPIPFYTALSAGAISIEADVWLYNSTLHVGHEESALTNARTFESLYIKPILHVLSRQNPANSSFLTAKTYNGVFDTSSGQTLYLFVDVKTDGASTWPVVVEALEPL